MRSALLQPFDTRMNHGFGRIEVRFADFQMNDASALALQLSRTAKHFKCGLAAHTLHPLRDPAFYIQLQSVNSMANKMTRQYNIGVCRRGLCPPQPLLPKIPLPIALPHPPTPPP